jgi:polysaccharide biosynthesis transport protein
MEPMPAQGGGAPNGKGKVPLKFPTTYRSQISASSYDGDGEKLQQLWQIIRRRGWIIGAIAAGAVIATAIYTLRQTHIYRGEFRLLVEPINREDKPSQLKEALGENRSQKSEFDYDTQIEVLQSQKILLPIISNINRNCRTNLDYNSLIQELKISRKDATKILLTSYQHPNTATIGCVLQELSQSYVDYSRQEKQATILQGIKFTETQIFQSRDKVGKLQAQLQAFRQKYNIVDPKAQAEQIAERLTNIESQRVESLVRLNEIRSLYRKLQAQLGTAPEKAIAFSALSESPRYQKLLDQLQEVEAQIADALATYKEDSPNVQALRDKQRNLSSLLSQEATRVVGKNIQPSATPRDESTSPSIIRSNLTQQLVESANQIEVLEVRIAGISQTQTALQRQLQQMPALARQYTDIERELAAANSSLNRFLEVKEKLQVEAAQKELPWQLLAAPVVSGKPVSPNLPGNVLLGAIAGVLLGLGVASILERLDNVFHSLDELKERTKLPILGIIPHEKNLTKIELEVKPPGWLSETIEDSRPDLSSPSPHNPYLDSAFLEAFCTLQANTNFACAETLLNSVVVSSAMPGDGKSTISYNLAQAAAAAGQRVLLVDADLRCPQLHEFLKLENQTGLSNFLVTETHFQQVLQTLPDWDSLYVMTAGDRLPSDPTRLLGSAKMHQLMQELESAFDLVIYDTPPILGLADGRLLVPHTAGLILVVKMGKTDRTTVKETIDLMKLSLANILGVVANGTRGRSSTSYYYDRYDSNPEKIERIEQAKRLLRKSLKKEDISS